MEEIYTTHRKGYASGTVGEDEAVGSVGAIRLQFAPRVVMAGVFPGQNTADSACAVMEVIPLCAE